MAYGWLFVLVGVYLLMPGLMAASGAPQALPWAIPSGNSSSISILSALFQAALFGTTGWAILADQNFAVKLVWAATILGGIGVVFRGLVPLEILIWLVSLGLAIWYTANRSFLGERLTGASALSSAPGTKASTRPARATLTFKPGSMLLAGLILCVVIAILVGPMRSSFGPRYAREELAKLNLPYDSRSFCAAAKNGDLVAVKLFLDAGMSPEAAFPAAIGYGRAEVVSLLLQRGANPNGSPPPTPLMDAAMSKSSSPEVVKLLLDSGARIDDGSPASALRLAVDMGRAEVMRELLDRGARGDPFELMSDLRVEDDNREKLEKARILLDNATDPNGNPSNLGRTLDGAISSKSVDVAQLVLDRGASPNSADADGMTPLMDAVIGRDISIVRLLLQRGADPTARINEGGIWKTAAMFAQENAETGIARLLAEGSASTRRRTDNQPSSKKTSAGEFDVVLERGTQLYDVNQYTKALAAFLRAENLLPDDSTAYYDAALCYEMLGQDYEAAGEYTSFLALATDDDTDRAGAMEWLKRNGFSVP